MKWLKTIFCKNELGTLGSSGLGSAENCCFEIASASISLFIRSYTGPNALRPNEVTKWLYELVIGTIEVAPNISP